MTYRRSFLFVTVSLSILVLGLCAAAQGTGAAGPFTIEQIMSAPFPGNLTAAPTGGNVAWVFNARGARNIWVAEAPSYKARQLTPYNQDDGYTITNLDWTPDGRTIVYVRGDGRNRQGELPNPTNDPAGVEQALWVISLDGGTPREIGAGSSSAVSPDGKTLAFIRRGQIWAAPLNEESKPEQLIKARGRAGGLHWSPDGSRLAFTSNRGNHSFIGVYEMAAKSLRYIEPSVDRDSSPVWSPDGTQLAFLRNPAASRRLPFKPRREGQPWSIRIVNVARGEGREVWRARTGRGSIFSGIVAANQLFWTKNDRLIFPWERDGWKHLYSVPVAGGKAIRLTPGEFEVEHVSINADRTAVIYSSNQDDIDRRHIWTAPVDGSGPARLLALGKANEWSPTPTADGKAIAFLQSGARTPARPAILIGKESPRDLAPEAIPGDFPSDKLVEPQQAIFAAADGLRIHGQLFLPSKPCPADGCPGVLFFHGGSRRQMLLGFHYLGYYHNAYSLNQYLASRGFIILSVNYRSGTNYGMEFREAIHYGAAGASEFNDVMGAGLYLQSRSDIDPGRIGLWGGSYGGYLTALGLARASDLFAAGVDLHGVHDWNQVIRNFVPSYDPNRRAEVARLAFKSSPMASIDTWHSPVLLIHGDDDRNVPFSESVDLAEALRKQGVYFEQLIFPDEVHGFLLHRSWLAAYHAAADFFERKLAKRVKGTGP